MDLGRGQDGEEEGGRRGGWARGWEAEDEVCVWSGGVDGVGHVLLQLVLFLGANVGRARTVIGSLLKLRPAKVAGLLGNTG